jgi:hypothetical protein
MFSGINISFIHILPYVNIIINKKIKNPAMSSLGFNTYLNMYLIDFFQDWLSVEAQKANHAERAIAVKRIVVVISTVRSLCFTFSILYSSK